MKKIVSVLWFVVCGSVCFGQVIFSFGGEGESDIPQDTAKKYKLKTVAHTTKMSFFLNLGMDSYVSKKDFYDSLGRLTYTEHYDTKKHVTSRSYNLYNEKNLLVRDSSVDDSDGCTYKEYYEYDKDGNNTRDVSISRRGEYTDGKYSYTDKFDTTVRTYTYGTEKNNAGKMTSKKLVSPTTTYKNGKTIHTGKLDSSVTFYKYGHDSVYVNHINYKNKDNNYNKLFITNKLGNDSAEFTYLSKKKKFLSTKYFYNEKNQLEQTSDYDKKGNRYAYTLYKYDEKNFRLSSESTSGGGDYNFMFLTKFLYEFY